MCACAPRVCSVWRSEEGVKSLRMGVTYEIIGSLTTEVTKVVRYHISAGNGALVFCKSSKGS